MSDTVKPLLPVMPIAAYKPKQVFGEPKPLLNTFPKDKNGKVLDGEKAQLGVIFGTARKINFTKRTLASGDVERSFCVDGEFEAIPADRERNPIRTPRAWFPPHIHALIAAALRENDPVNGEINEAGAISLDLSFVVGIESAERSSAGFVWTHVPTMEMKAQTDPLAHLRATLPAAYAPPALPKPEPVETPEEQEAREEAIELGDRQAAEGVERIHAEEAAEEAAGSAHKPKGGRGHK